MQTVLCVYKLDLTKVYDLVDWKYLEGSLVRLGFQSKWIRWIMECVTTVRYSVRFNNVLLDTFQPSCGLRQGDPLSPYLFLFVADGLSNILQKVHNGRLKDIRIFHGAPGISHLLFADDTLLFLEATESQAEVVNSSIKSYERCTGQLINPSKSSIMFGVSVPGDRQAAVSSRLDTPTIVLEEKYLGLPTPEGRMNKDKFKSTKERLAKRFKDWMEKYMSSGGKEIFIKSVAQAIPTYVMGVFKLLATLCEELNQMIRYFWWGEEGGQRKVHWVAWEKLLQPKCHGGIGFRDMRLFNQALLARQA